MLGYLDMTFCPYWEDCIEGRSCKRALTEGVYGSADTWWMGFNPKAKEGEAPIIMFAEEPDCYIEKEDIETFRKIHSEGGFDVNEVCTY